METFCLLGVLSQLKCSSLLFFDLGISTLMNLNSQT